MEEKQPMGLLFDSVRYYSPEDINSLCDEMTLEQAYFMIIKSFPLFSSPLPPIASGGLTLL